MFFSLTLLLTILALIFISWVLLIIDSRKFKIPGPTPYPILGNGHLFLGDGSKFIEIFEKLKLQYGNIYSFYIANQRYINTSNPKIVQNIVSGTKLITKGRSYDYLEPWLGHGLLTATGNQWKIHRQFLTPAFHFNVLKDFIPIFFKNNKILVEKLAKMADGRPVDIFPIIVLTALDNITECIMGTSINAQTDSDSKYVKSIGILSVLLGKRMRNIFASIDAIFSLMPEKKVQDEAIQFLHEYTEKVIENRRQQLKKQNNKINQQHNETNEYGIKNRYAFLDLLLSTQIDGIKIDDKRIREEVDTFMFAGHDTTTSGITFSLYCISKYPEVQEKILTEQRSILGEDIERNPTFAELQQMKYLELVIKESCRLYPPVPMIERLITQDSELNGMIVPKGVSVIIDIIHMQRDPDVFENPLEFQPERFETNTKTPFDWLVFSAGPRNCIGQKFAMLEMKAVISAVVKNFKLIPSDIDPILTADLILRSKNGVQIGFKPR